MSQIGSIPASSTGNITLDYCPERILLNPVGNELPSRIDALSVVISGKQTIQVNGADFLLALARLDNSSTGNAGDIVQGNYLRIAFGRVTKSTNLTISTNAGATVSILGASKSLAKPEIVRTAVQQTINPNSSGSFQGFECLVVEKANFTRAMVEFDNGFVDEYTPVELAALYGTDNQSTQGGEPVAGLILVSGLEISKVTFYTAANALKVVQSGLAQL